MELPTYITALALDQLPLDYAWDNLISDTIWATNDDDNPRLASAIQMISTKAAFALEIAASEWVVARVTGHVDTADALLRIEAAYAAGLDIRFTVLTPPAPRSPTQIFAYAGPLRLAMKLLAESFTQMKAAKPIGSFTQAMITLVDHIAGRHPAFQPWVTESLRLCHAQFPRVNLPLDQQEPVPVEFFSPTFAYSPGSGRASLDQFVQSLSPTSNPYLQSAANMLAAGYQGRPYGKSP